MFGLIPPSILEIKHICTEKKLFLIEDAAHAHGASIGGQKAGGIGDVGCFSFFATKVVTTGEGGAITTNCKDIFDKVNSLHDHGRAGISALFDAPGNNFRLPEIACVLGCHQIDELPNILSHRNVIGEIYRKGLANNEFVNILPVHGNSVHAYWRFAAYLSEKIDRHEFQKRMWDSYKIRITWMYEPLCHQQPVSLISQSQPSLPEAEWSVKHLINLPTHMGVSKEDARYVVHSILAEAEKMLS